MWRGRPAAERLVGTRCAPSSTPSTAHLHGTRPSPLPTTRAFSLLSTQMVAYIGAGMSDVQFGRLMDMGLGMTRAFFSAVEDRFPEPVITWEED